jgi:hypothetical protein
MSIAIAPSDEEIAAKKERHRAAAARLKAWRKEEKEDKKIRERAKRRSEKL